MKKYRIKDADGCEYEVKELTTVDNDMDEDDRIDVDVKTENEELTPEDIAALKKLAAIAPQLVELIEKPAAETTDEDVDVDVDKDEEDDVNVDVDTDENEDEEVVDTCGKKMRRDSKKSFGAIEREKKNVDDSLTDDIAAAWAKRYGGNR